jgi:hypothetical protein
LQQTFPLLCPEPYEHPKTTKLNLNTTKEEGDGNKLPFPSSLEHHQRRRRQCVVTPFFFLRHRKEGDDSLLSSPSLFQQHHKRR